MSPHTRSLRASLRALLLLALLLAPGRIASAQVVLVVNDLRDLADHDPNDGRCDGDPQMAGDQCTLRAALEYAQGVGGWVQVMLAPGVHPLERWGTDDVGRWGDLDVFATTLTRLELIGFPGQSVIDASPLAAQGYPDRVLHVTGTVPATTTVRVEGVTIRGGAGVQLGAGLRADGGEIELVDVALAQNEATLKGGGAYFATIAPVSIAGGVIGPANRAPDGGGAYLDAAGGAVVAQGVQFLDNVATGTLGSGAGGGVRHRRGTFEALGCGFVGNRGTEGGGLATRDVAVLRDCLFAGNEAFGAGGGLAAEIGGTSLLVERTTFEANVAANGGGGVQVSLPGARFEDCRFASNVAGASGGGASVSVTGAFERCAFVGNQALGAASASAGGGGLSLLGATTLRNVTIALNTAPAGLGGGVLVLGSNPMALSAVTIADNAAHGLGAGAGIFLDGGFGATNVTLAGAILGWNVHLDGTVESVAGTPGEQLASVGGCLDTDGSAGLAGSGDQSGSLSMPLDPMLDPPAIHGGYTETMAIRPGSPAIDAGACSDVAGDPILEDQRGVARLAPCDAGAYESPFVAPIGGCPTPLEQVADQQLGYVADVECGFCAPGPGQTVADAFVTPTPVVIATVLAWGGYDTAQPAAQDRFTVRVHADAGGLPGALVSSECDVTSTRTPTGALVMGQFDEYLHVLALRRPVALGPGTWWIELYNDTTGDPATWFVGSASVDPAAGTPGIAFDPTVPGAVWSPSAGELAIRLECGPPNTCPADLDGDGQVGFADLVILLAAWGPGCGPADLDGDADVGFGDLLAMQATWGACP